MQDIDVNRNVFYESGGSSFDIERFAKNIIKKIWLILLVGAIFGAGMFVSAKMSYKETYSAQMTLAFMSTQYVAVKDYSNSKDTQVEYKQETKFFSSSDTARYQSLIKGDEMIERIRKGLESDNIGKEYDDSYIANSLSIDNTPDGIAGFFIIKVTSEDKGYCERALNIVLKEFPDFIQSYDNTITIKVVNNPTTPSVNNADNALSEAFTGFIIGAALAIVYIFIKTIITKTVLTLDSLRQKIDINILGSVPLLEKSTGLFKNKKKTPLGSLLITDTSKVSFTFVESFKAIRTKIENINSEKGYKVFIVTSTYEDEGKTTVAVNIACSLAQKGKSVLLVDSDLRKPAILHAVGVKSDSSYGLIPIIKGTSTYSESIKFIKSLGIFVLPTGGVSLKSTEVLGTDVVKNIIDQAREEFDYIIIDSPPAHVVSDTLVIAPFADGIIYNIRRDYAKISEINHTLEEIRNTDADVVGAVFTMSGGEENSRYYRRKKSLRYGYYGKKRRYGYSNYGYNGYGNGYGYGGYGGYGNGYGYGYGYGYGNKDEKSE